jgi:competence protein ComEC
MRRPALNTLIPYMLGILAAGLVRMPAFWLWLIGLICLTGGFFLRGREIPFPIVGGQSFSRYGLLLAAIFVCGMLNLNRLMTSPIPAEFYGQSVQFSGRALYQPQQGQFWEECYAVGTIRPTKTPNRSAQAKILIRFRGYPVALRYGDHFEIEGILRKPTGQRNPGGFNYRAHLAHRQIFGILQLSRDTEIHPTHQSGLLLLRWTEKLRRRVESVIEQVYGEIPLHVQLVKGMFLGKRSRLPDEIISVFRNSGVFHILAVSGMHVGLIAFVCFLSFSLLGLPHKTTCLLTIATVILYACLVGFRPSVLRASLMVILFLLAQIIDRDADLFNLLAFAALLLLLINPAQLYDVGFQLSFVATFSIVYILPKWEQLTDRILRDERTDEDDDRPQLPVWKRSLKWVIIAFGVSFAAQIGTTCLIAYHFYRIYPISLIANLFVIGFVAPIVSLTLVSVIFGIVWIPLATPLAYANHFLIFLFLEIVEFFGNQLWTIIKTGPPSFGWIVVYIGVCLGIVHWRWVWEQGKYAVLIVLLIASIWVWDTANRAGADLLEVTFLDVGQGDAAFVRFPDRKTMLIDGGMTSIRIPGQLLLRVNDTFAKDLDNRTLSTQFRQEFARRNVPLSQNVAITLKKTDTTWLITDYERKYTVRREENHLNVYSEAKSFGYDCGKHILDPFLSHEGAAKLDLLLLSHPDNDHGGGFGHVLQEFGVKRVLGVPHRELPPKTHKALHRIIDLKGIPHELGTAGEINLTGTTQLTLLHPFDEASTNLTDDDVNDDSLVLKLTYRDVDILFTGDIERKAELRLISSDQDLRSEILKVPHHGSKSSSTAFFLDAVRPQYAICSVGERNRYGFPSEMVIKRYQERGCPVLRTDRLGAIRLLTDGHRCWIRSYNEP